MGDLDTIWRQCMECAGLAIFGFSLLMAAFCGLAALLAAIEGKEKTEADEGQSRHDAQAHGRGSDRRALRLV
jgi:hypothetical protein